MEKLHSLTCKPRITTLYKHIYIVIGINSFNIYTSISFYKYWDEDFHMRLALSNVQTGIVKHWFSQDDTHIFLNALRVSRDTKTIFLKNWPKTLLLMTMFWNGKQITWKKDRCQVGWMGKGWKEESAKDTIMFRVTKRLGCSLNESCKEPLHSYFVPHHKKGANSFWERLRTPALSQPLLQSIPTVKRTRVFL